MDGTAAPATRRPGGSAMNLSRRDLLKPAAVGAAATAAGAVAPSGRSASTADWVSSLSSSKMPRPYTRPLALAQPLPYRMAEDVDGPYRLYTVTQTTGQMRIIDGLPTPALGYGWTGVDGNPRFAVPGPYLSVPQGVRTKLRVKNGLPAAHPQWGYEMTTSTHLHGSASLPHPRTLVQSTAMNLTAGMASKVRRLGSSTTT